ncbi:dnaJ subfamily C member 9-like protein [Aphelenchoides avenae]|nr:dnaJ subfamily C member 9-like protein [Aphelenchus avenae]
MPFRDDCVELFGTQDLYAVLHLKAKPKAPTATEIKKAYYKTALLWHPDRYANSSDEEKESAKRKFQVLSRAYGILSDKEKRAVYDETGSMDDEDELSEKSFDAWYKAFKTMFKKVTPEEIENFQCHLGSEKEQEDVKKAYVKHKGDMNKILETVIGADVEQEDRIREIIRHFIDLGDVEAYPKFVNEKPEARVKRWKKAEKEAKEAGKLLKEMKENNVETGGDLASMIAANMEKRKAQSDSFLANLEAKYGGKGSKRKAIDDGAGPSKRRGKGSK